jgi:hypothetical protein
MYLGGISGCQLCMPRARELTYCSEDWNAEPQRAYSNQGLNVSKACNVYLEPSFDYENGLYKFEDVYSIDQTFQVCAVIGKCEIVQVLIFMNVV